MAVNVEAVTFSSSRQSTAFPGLAGDQLPLSPHMLASSAILHTPSRGLDATVVISYVGRRFLDEDDAAPVAGYATLAATLGWSLGRYGVFLEGENLINDRPQVTVSAFWRPISLSAERPHLAGALELQLVSLTA